MRGLNGPPLRYFGGKWAMSAEIVARMPAHRIYVEPYAGSASVLIRKPPCYSEVYNDQWKEVYNLFRVLRDPIDAARLRELLELTPYAREEFLAAKPGHPDEIEASRRLIVRSFQGFGADSVFGNISGFRPDSNKSGSTPAQDWARYPDRIPFFTKRLRKVILENRPALDVIRQHDRPDTLFYLDPPYVHGTRSLGDPSIKKHLYLFEMTDADHRELAAVARACQGMVMLSGYRSALYDELYHGWTRHDFPTYADGAEPRVECLWVNPRATADAPQPLLSGLN